MNMHPRSRVATCLFNLLAFFEKPRGITRSSRPALSRVAGPLAMLATLPGFLFTCLNAKDRNVYSVVGAGSFVINGFYFPVIGETYKYAMESDYPHGKQYVWHYTKHLTSLPAAKSR